MQKTWAHHNSLPLFGAKCIHEMILTASRRPDGSQLAEASGHGKVADDAEKEAVEKRNWTAGW